MMEYALYYLPFDEAGTEASDMRAEIRFEDYTPDLSEVADLWEKQTESVIDTDDPGEALNALWAYYNRGSGHEVAELDEKEMRSLSACDVVELDGTYYLCAPIGWEEIGGEA